MVVDPKANNHYQIEAHGNLDCAHWTDGPFCPHCGEREAIRTLHSQTARPGIYHCLTCRKRFAGVLDISFQDLRERPYRANSGGWLHKRASHAIWYTAHIIRQIIIGSDKPPR